ncbi:MAG: bifunctional adenosylcobinamide kinase/adenosylcobinamide-phosphate guanylyltransferase [Paracoccaceae bacterium]
MTLAKISLVLGGASSGKSSYAEALIAATQGRAVYVATAQSFDAEMANRISRHKTSRGQGWRTIEEPLQVADVLAGISADEVVLFDCLTLWLSNHMMAENDIDAEERRLIAALKACAAPVVIVSNEVGLGGVPENALARRFGQLQGKLNAVIAAEAGFVVNVIAGLPQVLKDTR